MNNNEEKLSQYIDTLNSEKKPKEHESPPNSPELEKLFGTVRLVRSLKEPALPPADYPKKLAHSVSAQLRKKTSSGARYKNLKQKWFTGATAIAAIAIIAILLNIVLPSGSPNIVHAMEKALQKIEAYHGILEFVEINAEGKETVQAKLEVWADMQERYYTRKLEGAQEGVITVNNGQKKWQIVPDQNQVYVFPAFPDPYKFTLELANEVTEAKNSLETKVIGKETVSGRETIIVEVIPQGGNPYHIWIDKKTNLPLQKQSSMVNALQYRVTYTDIDFYDSIPEELLSYNVPEGFDVFDTSPELLVNNLDEAAEIAGFVPKIPEDVPEGFKQDKIAVAVNENITKLYYASQDKETVAIVLQGKSKGEFKPVSNAVLGKIGDNTAEIQSPVEGDSGILSGSGLYAGITEITAIRWQEKEFEYAIVGNVSLEELALFAEGLSGNKLHIPSKTEAHIKPKVEVPVDLEIEENEQKSVDAGHSPWKLDPVYVAQVFVSLKISPEGIQGDYPINYEEIKIVENTGAEAIVEVAGDETPIRRIYLKRLIRQDSTGIWTVVGYDPVERE